MDSRLAACSCLFLLAPAALAAQPAEVTFELVPSVEWADGRPDPSHFLPEGSIRLYRIGESEPELTLDAGRPGTVPDGEWEWIAEAPGFVSTVSGTLVAGDGTDQTIVWPVEPACRVVLSEERAWRGVSRLNVVSVAHGALYPLRPSARRDLWAPAGELIVYGEGPRGLLGIHRLQGCEPSARIETRPPAPPPRHLQDLMVSVEHLGAPDEHDPLQAYLTPSVGGELAPAVRPTVRVVRGTRSIDFFLAVSADRNLVLVLEHPAVRTRRIAVEALGGSVRELPAVTLAERLDLAIEIDYRPLREHREAVLEVQWCGDPARPDFSWNSCRRLERAQPLSSGRHRYVFEALDDGQYVLDARIDDEVLAGLGQSVAPLLDPESELAPELPLVPLWEFEISGRLLVDGDPVAGWVGFQPVGRSTRTFPTDDDLIYHLYYFGTLPWNWEELPDRGAREEMLGLRWGIPSACSQNGYCRFYNLHSIFLGGGTLDWNLGSEHRFRLRVEDATTGDPVPGADVLVPIRRTALRFDTGDVEEVRAPGAEWTGTVTDAEGVARIRMPTGLPPSFSVSKEGYRTVSVGNADPVLSGPADDEPVTIEVALEPEAPTFDTARLVFPDGSPLAGAFLMAVGPDGVADLRCSRSADGFGAVKLRPGCEEVEELMVFHPGAALRPISASDVALLAEVEVARRPGRPLRVGLVDPAGTPLARVPVGLRIGGVLLDPNLLVAAASRSGFVLPVATDADGVLVLRGVDRNTPGGVELVIGTGDETETLDLGGLSPEDGVALLTVGG